MNILWESRKGTMRGYSREEEEQKLDDMKMD